MTHNPAEALREALLPCPFCGGAPWLTHDNGAYIFCQSCTVRTSCFSFTKPEEAIAQWNRRAALTSPAPAGGEARETCKTCQGNGEIVTDWERYMHAHPGDKGDEAVAECADCDGEGTVTVTPPPSPDVAGVVEYLRKAAAFLPFSDVKTDLTLAERAKLLEAATLLESLSADKARLTEAFACAVGLIMEREPPDSRAVSDIAVSLASVECGTDNPECWEIIRRENKRMGSQNG